MMRSTKQKFPINDLHRELKTRYREFFESQLAIHLLGHPKYFPAVRKISTVILKLIENNKSIVLNTIKENPKIVMELQKPYFGSFLDHKKAVSTDDAYEKIVTILNDENSDLSSVMQLHCIFVYRIYENIEKGEKSVKEKNDWQDVLFPYSLFNEKARSRIKKEGTVKATDQLGIANNPVFSKMLEKSNKKHIRALDRYEPDTTSDFSRSAADMTIPIVCGPSGHTASLLLGTKLYGNLTSTELNEYALASFAFLTAGGNHSFHEVFIIANLLGVTYNAGHYSTNIPESIASSTSYKDIKSRFPDFLDSNRDYKSY